MVLLKGGKTSDPSLYSDRVSGRCSLKKSLDVVILRGFWLKPVFPRRGRQFGLVESKKRPLALKDGFDQRRFGSESYTLRGSSCFRKIVCQGEGGTQSQRDLTKSTGSPRRGSRKELMRC